jgi:hypothetical protein
MKSRVVRKRARSVLELATALALLPLGAWTGAAPPSGPQDEPRDPDRAPRTFRLDVDYMEVMAIVTDRSGRFVPGLSRDDFEVDAGARHSGTRTVSFQVLPF